MPVGEAPSDGGRVVLPRAAQQPRVRRPVARVLQGRRCARFPSLALVVPGRLHALDSRPRDIAVLAVEGDGVGHHELDQLVDVVAERRQRERLPVADRLSPAHLDALRLLRVEVRVAAEAVQVGRVRRAKRRARRESDE